MKNYDIDPDKLQQIFKNTTATYKFYWMLALLDSIRSGKTTKPITFNEMVGRMVGMAWQPLVSGLFTFGKCDALLKRIQQLLFNTELKAADDEARVAYYIMSNPTDESVKKLVSEMTKYVPFRFLSPWLGTKMSNKDTASASQNFSLYRSPYGIFGNTILVSPLWRDYLLDHLEILEGFTRYHLLAYLQRYNDNVVLPDDQLADTTADGMAMPTLYVAEESEEMTKLKKTVGNLKKQINTLKPIISSLEKWGKLSAINFFSGDQLNVSNGIVLKNEFKK